MKQKISTRMYQFLDKLDTLCWENGMEIWPTPKGWTGKTNEDGELETVAIIDKTTGESCKVAYIDGDGRGK